MLSYVRMSLNELITQTNLNNNTLIKGALSRHLYCFSVKTIQKSFFLTFTRAENISLKLRQQSIFYKKRNPRYIFSFTLKMGTKLRLNFSKCNPSPSLPSAPTERGKQSQGSYLVLSKQASSLFFHRCKDIF